MTITLDEIIVLANAPIDGDPEIVRAWFAFGLGAIAVILIPLFVCVFVQAAEWWQTRKDRR